MGFKGILKTGQDYKITVDSDPATPGITALMLGWVPPAGTPATSPVIETFGPGGRFEHAGKVPSAQGLILDFDLPDTPSAKITITIAQGTNVVASGSEVIDREWSFLVIA